MMTKARRNRLLRGVLLAAGALLVFVALTSSGGEQEKRASEPLATASASVIAAPRARRLPRVELTREGPRADVVGRVLDAASGAPIAGALVTLHAHELGGHVKAWWEGEERIPALETDDRGEFRFPDVPPSRYALRGAARGYEPQEIEQVRPGQPLTLQLRRGGVELKGHVEDIYGGPIASATVTARAVGSAGKMAYTHAPAAARTAEDGTYVLTLSTGTYELEASRADYASESAVVRIDGAAARDFVLAPSGRIAGTVRDAATGEPVALARVYVRAMSDPTVQGLDVAAESDEQGEFVVTNVAPGFLQVYATDELRTSWKPEAVRIGPGETMNGITLWVQEAGEIRGRVLSESGDTPVAGALVTALAMEGQRMYMADAPSDERGEFRISGVLAGSFILQTVAEGYQPGFDANAVTVGSGQTAEVTVRLSKGITLSGQVHPPQSARIRLEMTVTGQEWATIKSAQANSLVAGAAGADGTFKLSGLASGVVRVVAETDDGKSGEQSVTIAHQSVEGVRIELAARATLSGVVRDTSGAKVHGRVYARRVDDHLGMMRTESLFGLAGVPVNERGEFLIANVRGGEYLLSLSDLEGMPLALRVEGASGTKQAESLRVRVPDQGSPPFLTLLTSSRRVALRGVVLSAEGPPAASVLISARPAEQSAGVRVHLSPRRAVSGADGSFELSDLVEGQSYAITAEHLESAQRKELPRVRIASSSSLRIQLEADSELTVHVRGAVKGGSCKVHLSGPKRSVLPCAADGRVVFSNLSPGKYQVLVDSAGGYGQTDLELSTATASVDVTIGSWGRVQGRLAASDGRPLGDTPLLLRGQGRSPQFGVFAVLVGSAPKTDAEGAFDIERVPPGPTELIVLEKNGLAQGERALVRFEVAKDRTTRLGDVRLKGAAPSGTTSTPKEARSDAPPSSTAVARSEVER